MADNIKQSFAEKPNLPPKPSKREDFRLRPTSAPVAPPKPPGRFNRKIHVQSLNIENILEGRDILNIDKNLLRPYIANPQVNGSEHAIKPNRPPRPLSKRPLPQLPKAVESKRTNEFNQDNKKSQGHLAPQSILEKLKIDLDQNSNVRKPQTNLSKLKSVSSPSLFHRDERIDDEICCNSAFDSDYDVDLHDVTDGFFSKKPQKDVDKTKLHKVTSKTQQLNKGRKKWQSFSGAKLKTMNITKETDRKRSNTKISEDVIHEFEEFSDLQQDDGSALFENVLVVSLKKEADSKLVPYISFQFPPKIEENDEKDQLLESIPQFCFPDLSMENEYGYNTSETFSFVLTDMDGGRNYGFCRMIQVSSSTYPEVYCIISPHGLFSLYVQILEEVEKQRVYSRTAVFSFLKAVLSHDLPKPSSSLTVSFYTSGGSNNVKKIPLHRPGDSAIHEHVDLSLLFTTLPISLIIHLLTSLLMESKVILSSKSLSLLSSCCHALISLMYPFTWQHTYIPVLPSKLIDMVCLPSPYLIGILPSAIQAMEDLPVEEVTVVNLDEGKTVKMFKQNEIINLPKQVREEVKNALEEIMHFSKETESFGLTEQKARNKVITEVFLHAYLHLIGHFDDHYSVDEYGEPAMTGKAFYHAAQSKEQKKFLKLFMKTNVFQQFVVSRKVNGPSQGLFENRYMEWKRMRCDGGKLKFKDLLFGFKKALKF